MLLRGKAKVSPAKEEGGKSAASADAESSPSRVTDSLSSLSLSAETAASPQSSRKEEEPQPGPAAGEAPPSTPQPAQRPPAGGALELQPPFKSKYKLASLAVTYSSKGVAFPATVTLDFESQSLVVKLDDNLRKLTLRLADVASYSVEPELRRELQLTLRESTSIAVSPGGARLPDGVSDRDCVLTFKSAKFNEVAEEMRAAFRRRIGSFHTDFVVVPGSGPRGEGGNGVVFDAKRRGSSAASTVYAVKQPKHSLDLKQEVALMRALGSCPYITHFEAFYEDAEGQFLVMELMEGGDVFDLVSARGKAAGRAGEARPWLSDEEVRLVGWRMLKGLEYMHEQHGMLHRDIKPENVLLAGRGADGLGDPATAKLADFGHSKQMDGASRTWTVKGTPVYNAPEVKGEWGHGMPSDLWQLGATLFFMLLQAMFCEEHAGGGVAEEGAAGSSASLNCAKRVKPGSVQSVLLGLRDAQAVSLMDALIEHEAAKRPTARVALAHAWFEGLEQQK